ncbi:MAG: tRNA 2-thiocytidine(32) synthetase TtcA, partial [Clostridia bacterium]|nr:tRNA 2-thiocytidine(32) synthetase TtcA [Clostridia bacterium]
MNEQKRLLSFIRRAVDDYSMIDDGDKSAVGVSGGKDSLTLLATLCALKRFYPKRFELVAISINMGFDGMDFTPVKEFCAEREVEYHVVNTEIAKIIFDVRRESNPCSLCAKMRRGSLH